MAARAAKQPQSSADFVKSARAKLGMSLMEFSAALGVGRHTIWRYERGETMPERSRIMIEHLLTREKESRRTR